MEINHHAWGVAMCVGVAVHVELSHKMGVRVAGVSPDVDVDGAHAHALTSAVPELEDAVLAGDALWQLHVEVALAHVTRDRCSVLHGSGLPSATRVGGGSCEH